MLRTRAYLLRDGQPIDIGLVDVAWDEVPVPPYGIPLPPCPECRRVLEQSKADPGRCDCAGCGVRFSIETGTDRG
jgi:hypothetical protein